MNKEKMKHMLLTFVQTAYITLFIQAVVSAFFIYYLYVLDILPGSLVAVAGLVLAVLWLMAFIIQFRSKKISFRSILSRLISIIISVLLIIGCSYVKRTDKSIQTIGNDKYETVVYSVVVLQDSQIKDIKELANKKVNLNVSINNSFSTKAKKNLDSQVNGIAWTFSPDYTSLSDSLYNKECDAIVINEAYRGIIEETHPEFDNETRVIYTIDVAKNVTESAKNITNGVFNIYISGIDTAGPIGTVSRSDVNMILSVNMNTHEILMTSIPRDMYVKLRSFNAYDKLTHSGIYGIDETVGTIEDFLDISINYYVRVNFSSLITLVDAIGGIDVYSDQELNLGGYHYDLGMNHMNGEQALRFARERHSYESGDLHRTQNQQDVLTAIIEKMASFKTITNYDDVLTAVEGAFNTNMPSDDIKSIAKHQVENMTSWNIRHQYVTGNGTRMYGLYSMPNSYLYTTIPDENAVNSCKQAIDQVLQ